MLGVMVVLELRLVTLGAASDCRPFRPSVSSSASISSSPGMLAPSCISWMKCGTPPSSAARARRQWPENPCSASSHKLSTILPKFSAAAVQRAPAAMLCCATGLAPGQLAEHKA